MENLITARRRTSFVPTMSRTRCVAADYTPAEKRLAAQHNMTPAKVRSTAAALRTIPGYPCDADGMPIFYTMDESFTALDRKIIEHYGEEIRPMINLSRAKCGMKPLVDFARYSRLTYSVVIPKIVA